MSTFTLQLQENLRDGKQVIEALRDCTPGKGRFAGVTHEDVEQLALRFSALAMRQHELLAAGVTVDRGLAGTAKVLCHRAASVALVIHAAQRKGPRGAFALVLSLGAVAEAAKWAQVKL